MKLWSPVVSANAWIRSWETSTQDDGPNSAPTSIALTARNATRSLRLERRASTRAGRCSGMSPEPSCESRSLLAPQSVDASVCEADQSTDDSDSDPCLPGG